MSEDTRINKAYTERTISAVLLAKEVLKNGGNAGVGKDDNKDWENQWRVVLYVDTQFGQISWHIAPYDQHMLEGLPKYKGKWDKTFNSSNPEFCKKGIRK